MRWRLVSTLAVLLLLSVSQARAQKVKDPAALMPANTLAYGEVRQPGQLIKEIASLFEGSAFGNFPDSLFKLMEEQKAPRPRAAALGAQEMAVLLLLSPEVIRETQRLGNAGVGLTGFTRSGEPEWVAVILPGQSNVLPFAMRTLISTGHTRLAGQVEGVRLYEVAFGGSRAEKRVPAVPVPERKPIEKEEGPQDREPPRNRVVQDRPVAIQEGAGQTVVALMADAVLIGSSAPVRDVIRRIRSKKDEESLAGEKKFQEARKEMGDQAGVYFYYDPNALISSLVKSVGGDKGRELAGLAEIKKFLGLEAFRAAANGLSLEKGTLRYRELALLDPKQKSPVLSLLPAKAVNREVFRFAPDGAIFAAAMSNDGGEERWKRALDMMDAFAGIAGGDRHLPSEHVAELEKLLDISVGKDVMGNITTVGFALGDPLEAPRKKIEEKGENFRRVSVYTEVPVVVVVRTSSEDAARKIAEKVVPKVFGLMTNNKNAEPATLEMRGQTIQALKGRRPQETLHYGRVGSTLVLGPYPEPVAQALANGKKQKSTLIGEKLAARLDKLENPVGLAVARPFSFLAGMFSIGGYTMEERRAPDPDRREKDAPPRKADERPAPPKAVPVKRNAEEERLTTELGKLVGQSDSVLVVSLTRQADRIQFQMEWTGLKPIVARVTDFILRQQFRKRSAKPSEPPTREKDERKPSPSKDR